MGLWGKILRSVGLKSSDRTQREEEQIQIAIALSISEQDPIAQQDTERQTETESKSESGDDARRTNVRMEERNQHAKGQIEEDEPIIQKVLNAKEFSHLPDEDIKTHSKAQLEENEQHAKKTLPSKCAGCNSKIEHGKFLSRLDAVWHPECFKCHSCKIPITDDEFSKSKRRLYHKSCYEKRHPPKCLVCKDFVPPNADGVTEFRKHPFWPETYCPEHEADGTSKCCSCERLVPKDMTYITYEDRRKICFECLDSATLDTHDCHTLYDEMKIYFEGLNMRVGQEFCVFLVERDVLNKAMDEEKNEHHNVAETRGVCLSEVESFRAVASLKKLENEAGKQLTGMITESHMPTRQCEVTAILIIYGLPRLLTGSILAHEMMHAWLRLNGYRNLEPKVEEGICQVLAHMWLESQTYAGDDASSSLPSSSSPPPPPPAATTSKKGERSDFEKKLCELFKYQIASDSSPVYGVGYKEANDAVSMYLLPKTLRNIRITGGFHSSAYDTNTH